MRAEKTCLAITGDLRHSRRAGDRAELQRRLIAVIEDLNSEHSNDGSLAAPVAMTAGDAVQCLLNDRSLAAGIIGALGDAARPSEFTFGIGLGSLSTDLHRNVALIDGPAFHFAREALEQARSDDAWAAAKGFGEHDDAITAVLYLLGAARRRWTDRQVEMVRLMSEMETQTEVAEALDISPSVVSESLKAAAWRQYEFGSGVLRELLVRG